MGSRIMMRIVAIAVAAGLTVQPALAQQAVAPFQPAGPWNVEYADSICTLSREFAGPDGPVRLGFAPLTGGGSVKILLLNLPHGERHGTGKVLISTKPGTPASRDYYAMPDTGGKPIMLIRAGRGDLSQIGSAALLTFDVKGKIAQFAVPGIAAALSALDACEVDLEKSWGYDPAAVSEAAAPINPGGWLSDDDYPGSAMAKGEAGETDFRLAIGPDGKPTDCIVILKSGSPTLDTQTCDRLKHQARFSPARGLDGKPVAGIYSNAMMWQLGF
jgi:hypothetical protein